MMTRNDADKYINTHRVEKNERPSFHVTAPVGWINDPNGFSVYKDKIHLFYQFHPYSTVWGPMHWGHYTTKDFITWEELPVALAPDQEFDAGGCFSGTAIEVDGKHVLIYTGVTEQTNEDGTKSSFQNQCIAVGNGETYEKPDANPVIDGSMLPADCNRSDFRDPKIWRAEDGTYYVLAGNKTYDGIPQVVLFRSKDLKQWSFASVFARDDDRQFGTMWECPDYFRLAGTDVFICSPQDMMADEEFHNGNNVACFLGKLNEDTLTFHTDKVFSLDYGFDFYAPQSIETADGRRVLIGWMQSWDTSNALPTDQKWAGMMTIPRELELKGDTLLQNPVRELADYHTNETIVKAAVRGESKLNGIQGRILDMTVVVEDGDFNRFSIALAADGKHRTTFSYSKTTKELTCDRTYAGWIRDINCTRTMRVKNEAGLKTLRFVMDQHSIELFINDGEQVFSTVIHTPMDAEDILFDCDGVVNISVTKYDLRFR